MGAGFFTVEERGFINMERVKTKMGPVVLDEDRNY